VPTRQLGHEAHAVLALRGEGDRSGAVVRPCRQFDAPFRRASARGRLSLVRPRPKPPRQDGGALGDAMTTLRWKASASTLWRRPVRARRVSSRGRDQFRPKPSDMSIGHRIGVSNRARTGQSWSPQLAHVAPGYGVDRANAVTVALGTGGTLSATYAAPTYGPTAHVIFDVTGYFTP
jgi:hypothetical protein